ncbi:hypothetical protein [Kitasatospora sp. SUK 42]|uniref:hypothetical protein n=1 Tax=Kitasatospora sp. SUK 42 TaxID=1588882 RepID=UPI0018CBBB07|nr:hypothetical protein [Kitasatospora sp. SUK 42]MBV2154005.1 DUF1631 domain-containing protein [Kitasatospora sp. SUK 42]
MSEPSASPQLPSSPTGSAASASAGPETPKSLLEQMQELLASVTADLAALQSGTVDTAPDPAYPADTDTSSEAPASPTAPGAW